MNADQINRWLTLAANIGVLVGIVVLIVEIGQNTDLMRAQMVQARADMLAAQYDAQINADFWPEIMAKWRAASSDDEWIESLSPVDYERVFMAYLKDTNYLQHLFYQYQEGYMPPEIWNGTVRRQFVRYFEFAKLFSRTCAREEAFNLMLRELADEEDIAVCAEDGHWESSDADESQSRIRETN